MKEKLIKILNSYKYEFCEQDDELSFDVSFNNGTGEYFLYEKEGKLSFKLKLNINLDILSSEYLEKLINHLNLALKKGSFIVSPIVFNPMYVYEISDLTLSEIEIAKIIDESIDTCDMFIDIFQMVLSGKSIEEVINEIEAKPLGNC